MSWQEPALPRPEIGKPDRKWVRSGEDVQGHSTWYSIQRQVKGLKINMPADLKQARRLVAGLSDKEKDELIAALRS